MTDSEPTPLSRSVYAARLAEFPDVVVDGGGGGGGVIGVGGARRGGWGAFFRERMGAAFGGRVVFEVGCFDAEFLCRVAARFPGVGFVGLDWKAKAIYAGAGRVTEMGLRNVALVRGRGQDVPHLFAAGEVDEVWVFHPDPFDEPGELKNRLFAEPFLLAVHAALRPGGALVLKTDHAGYFAWALGLFGLAGLGVSEVLRGRFAVRRTSADFWKDSGAQAHVAGRAFAGETTLFEGRFVGRGLPIYFMEIARVG